MASACVVDDHPAPADGFTALDYDGEQSLASVRRPHVIEGSSRRRPPRSASRHGGRGYAATRAGNAHGRAAAPCHGAASRRRTPATKRTTRRTEEELLAATTELNLPVGFGSESAPTGSRETRGRSRRRTKRRRRRASDGPRRRVPGADGATFTEAEQAFHGAHRVDARRTYGVQSRRRGAFLAARRRLAATQAAVAAARPGAAATALVGPAGRRRRRHW